ncbi:MAG: aminopeptidase N [Cellvibrionaceae bacterium]|nr:aminopeptidase N [Cellvibrionaceae bacterium]
MKESQPEAVYLKDYQSPHFLIEKTQLSFDLFEDYTEVRAQLTIVRSASADQNSPLVLDGQDVKLMSLAIDGEALPSDAYLVDENSLKIFDVPQRFELSCITQIKPQENTSLQGLYRSRTMYCTQCEAEGFRKITYFIDRPDVMSEFTTRISAEKSKFPVLLSNGNKIDAGEDGERHWVVWHDPFKKPSYLFALVAGSLVHIDDTFTTVSGREVLLRIFVEEKDKDKCDHAMQSLKRAMAWDEEVYGREYDLDIFMIVAVDDFNMGAMENKGLNIFNTSCVLAKQETTTDAGFQRVEGVVAHEYFHNWSGNRVTCRDWFQLSLKEGFTVFRDAEFSADMGSRTVKRVEDVSLLRSLQFAEDAGPMAHPVQPSSFIEISNFYTLTVYEKGAEVVRMIHTLLGSELFRKGSDLYFERHDGEAVTIEDFVKAMADVSGADFSQFMHWYRQAGTPKLQIDGEYQAEAKTFSLHVKQSCAPTAECEHKQPFLIPMQVSLHGEAGALKLQLRGETANAETKDNTQRVLEINQAQQSFVFENIAEQPIPALFKGFSAPINYQYRYSLEELAHLVMHDDDGFCRWDACQQMSLRVIDSVMQQMGTTPSPEVPAVFLEVLSSLLESTSQDPAMVALMLSLPSEQFIGEQKSLIDVDAIHHARNRVKRKLAQSMFDVLMPRYQTLSAPQVYQPSAQQIAQRSLKNTALQYLIFSGREEGFALARAQYENADNMTDQLAALTAIVHSPKSGKQEQRDETLTDFYRRWRSEPLVMNNWLAVQASCALPGALKRVKLLMQHEAYDARNPNKIRAVVGTFCTQNIVNFHDKSGAGYEFLRDQIIILNKQNPQVAARLLTPLTRWKRYDDVRKNLMRDALRAIQAQPNLSKDVYEVVMKSLL